MYAGRVYEGSRWPSPAVLRPSREVETLRPYVKKPVNECESHESHAGRVCACIQRTGQRCRARVTPARSPCRAYIACVPRLRQHQPFSRTLLSQLPKTVHPPPLTKAQFSSARKNGYVSVQSKAYATIPTDPQATHTAVIGEGKELKTPNMHSTSLPAP